MLSLIEMQHQAVGLLIDHTPSDLFLLELLNTSTMRVIEYMANASKNIYEAYDVICSKWGVLTISLCSTKTGGINNRSIVLVGINETIKEQIELRMNALGRAL